MKTRKTLVCLVLALVMVLSAGALSACAGGDGNEYTLREFLSASPNTLCNPHIWETNADSYAMGYTMSGLIEVTYTEDMSTYQWVHEMAVSHEDVTSKMTAEQKAKYGVPADATEGYMWKYTLRKDLKWDDGTKITAEDYVYSMHQALDPKMQNYRAGSYTEGDAELANAYNFFHSGTTAFPSMSYDSGAAAIAAGEKLYVNVTDFWGVKAPDGSKYASITDETLIRDPAVAEGKPEDYVSGKYLWDTYLADGQVYAGYQSSYVVMKKDIPVTEWDKVGIYKDGDYTLYLVTKNQLDDWNFCMYLGGLELVKKDLYEAGKTQSGDLTVTNYGTTAETCASFGPYKIAAYEIDKQIVFEKNTNWYGWAAAKKAKQYQTTKIVCQIVTDHNTALQMFVKGELDSVDLTSDDMNTYRFSDYLIKMDDPNAYTMRFVFNSDKDALKTISQNSGKDVNLQILSNINFRKAFSLSIDRARFAQEVTAGEKPAFTLLSSLYYYDVANDNNSVYRNSEEGKKVIADLYGLEYGAGKKYATLDDAVKAATGYDVEEAKKLFQKSYDEALAAGLISATDKVSIKVYAAKSTISEELTAQQNLMNKFLAEATKGTSLEGKVTLEYKTNSDRYGAIGKGQIEMMWGAWGGAWMRPFYMIGVYTNNDDGKMNEYGFNPYTETITITGDFGKGTETLTKSYDAWQKAVDIGGEYSKLKIETKLHILAQLEYNLLDQCHMAPVSIAATVQMISQKINYGSESYNIMAGFGGIRLMTYNYSDAQWAEYVTSQGGTLDYE